MLGFARLHADAIVQVRPDFQPEGVPVIYQRFHS